ncbi:MAG: transcriptional repressor [Pseudonocardiales bacterium]|nr:MAG: transcriptional repressor [Pseudonocardiales bacterium]
MTPQRQLVLDSVEALRHATPEEICADVRRTAAGVNITTVYRTLELLEGLGMVTHTHLGHGAPTFHASGGEEHVHLVCQACSEVTEAPPSLVDGVARQLAAERGFAVDVGHFAIFGTCAACQAAGTVQDT